MQVRKLLVRFSRGFGTATITLAVLLGQSVTGGAWWVTPARAVPLTVSVSHELWAPPLGAPLRIAAPFSLPHGPYRAGHRGLDFPADPGMTVRTPVSGRVSFVGTVVDRPLISIELDAYTVISMEPVSSELAVGDLVVRGAEIGEVATGGHCADACMHLGVRVNEVYVNPLRYFKPKPVLLPW